MPPESNLATEKVDILRGKLFEVHTPTQNFVVYADGKTEGFGPNAIVQNWYPAMRRAILAEKL